MCAFSLLNLETSGWPQWWLNSSCSESIMTSVILPLVLQGLFAVLIKDADWWLGVKPGCVGIFYTCNTVQFETCMCVFRQAWRTAEVKHLEPEPYWCFHTCHRSSDPYQHNVFRVNSWGVFQREEMRKSVEKDHTVRLWLYNMLQILFFRVTWSKLLPAFSFWLDFCKLPRIHWHSEGLLCLFLTPSHHFWFWCYIFVISK